MTELWQRVRAVDRHHPLWWDIAPALLTAAITVSATPRLDLLGVALLLIVHGAVVLRRRTPLPALLVASGGIVLAGGLTMLTALDLPWMYPAVWLLLFHHGLRVRSHRDAVAVAIIALTAASALAAPNEQDVLHAGEHVGSALAVLGMCAASFLLGLQVRSRREQVARQQAEIARDAALAERSRIAQEMHDIIGHNLSVITSLANGGAVAAGTAPQDATQAFDAIGEVSRSSVRDVRRILTVLRHDYSPDGAALGPQPGLDDIPALIDSVRSAGPAVRLERTGDARGSSAGRELAAYRIVQESLTNTLRHVGTNAHVTVTITEDPEALTVAVADSGPTIATAGPEAADGSGQGINGMRERADAYGGTLEAGATSTGWRVEARIPTDGSRR